MDRFRFNVHTAVLNIVRYPLSVIRNAHLDVLPKPNS